jgi:hypothetical protein
VKITQLDKTIGWKLEPQTREEYGIALSMLEALELKTNTDKNELLDDQQAID